MPGGWTERIGEAMAAGSPWLLPLAFLGGLCTSLNPCAYPMMGAVAAYVWGQGERSAARSTAVAAAFLLGLSLTYTVLGVVGCLVGPLLGLSRTGWAWLVGLVCIVAGLLMADVIHVELPSFSPLSRVWHRLHGIPGAIVLGALLGLVAAPCATPPLVVILSLAASTRAVAFAALLLLAYAIGHGLPAVLIGLLAGSLSSLERLAPYGRALQLAGGWLIIAVGFYFILTA